MCSILPVTLGSLKNRQTPFFSSLLNDSLNGIVRVDGRPHHPIAGG
jgi:hypothetical protein